MSFHILLVAGSPFLRAGEYLPGRKRAASNRADEVVLDNPFVLWSIMDRAVAANRVRNFAFIEKDMQLTIQRTVQEFESDVRFHLAIPRLQFGR